MRDTSWPADMEVRRLADLAKFVSNNPNYVLPRSLAEQLQLCSAGNGKGCNAAVANSPGKVNTKSKKPKRPHNNENRWDLATSLELLEAVKEFVHRHKLRSIGADKLKWKAVSSGLSNPRGLEQTKYSRSCQVRYENIRRYMKGDKRGHVDAEVQQSMNEIFKIYEFYAAEASGKPRNPSPPPTIVNCQQARSCPSNESYPSENLDDNAIVVFQPVAKDDHDDGTLGVDNDTRSETEETSKGKEIDNEDNYGSISTASRRLARTRIGLMRLTTSNGSKKSLEVLSLAD